MLKYKKRYQNKTEQCAYENACDCIYYGYSIKYWIDCGIDKGKRDSIWNAALTDMASDE